MMMDGLRGCDQCGNDTTGRLCRSCAEQEMIDNDPNPPPIVTLWCELCGIPIGGMPSGMNVVDVCEECGQDIVFPSYRLDTNGWDIHIHPYLT